MKYSHYIIIALTFISIFSSIHAQEILWDHEASTITTNRAVKDVVAYNSRLLIGGEFDAVAPYNGGWTAVDPTTGKPLPNFPEFNGSILVEPYHKGGWIILDGEYTSSYREQVRLLHVQPDGSIAREIFLELWGHAFSSPSGVISCTQLHGDTLYFSGSLQRINNIERRWAAAIDVTSGEILPWSPRLNAGITSMHYYKDRIILCGLFDSVEGNPQQYFAQVDPQTGAYIPWPYPLPSSLTKADFLLNKRAWIFGDRLYTTVGSMDLTTGEAGPWEPTIFLPELPGYPYRISSLAAQDDVIYTVGPFTRFNNRVRNGIAAVDEATGQVLPWRANAESHYAPGDTVSGPGLYSIALNSTTAFISGIFTRFNGEPRPGFAALDLATGALLDWQPSVIPWKYPVLLGRSVLYADDNVVFIGGLLASTGLPVTLRHGFVEVDRNTNMPTSWDPGFTSVSADSGMLYDHINVVHINAFARNGSTLYAGGIFDSVSGKPRSRLCAFDLDTRTLLPWAPAIEGIRVDNLLYHNGRVYVTGRFYAVNGIPRQAAAAVDAATGELLPWKVDLDSTVTAMEVRDGRVYIGGNFSSVNGVERHGFAVVDALSGEVLDEGPQLPQRATVSGMTTTDSRVYLSGMRMGKDVTQISLDVPGLSFAGFGGFNRTTGLLEWLPVFEVPTNALMYELQYHNGTLIGSGVFWMRKDGITDNLPDSVEWKTRTFDTETGALIADGPDVAADDFLITGDTMFLWGYFHRAAARSTPYFAMLTRASSDVPFHDNNRFVSDSSLELYPNPARTDVTVRSRRQSSTGTIVLFDQLGRVVARAPLLHGTASLKLENIPQGTYIVSNGFDTRLLTIVK